MADAIKGEICPVCFEKKLVLMEEEMDIPFFGKTFLFSMKCDGCGFHKSDIEAEEMKDPCRLTFTIEKEADMNVRVVKSSEATIKVSQLKMSVTPGPASEGYISNIEGILTRFEKVIEGERDASEEDDVKTTAKNLLKKIRKVKWGEMPLKIVIEDPSGNSAIISERTIVEKLKAEKKTKKK
ncbi:ZPR1 zinc finger domain-containing protein [Candidatus Woesearchaeota archaeon]|nr:ZPR1 zinc finger domain-containing protein [Candidatus Woesearchaeota archaeon]